MGNWAIAVLGGAGVDPNLPQHRQEEAKQLLTRCLNIGISALRSNCSAIDVVELVVRELESDPLFNSGRGSALTEKGTVEMEAGIVDGTKRRCGAVSGVTTVKNPVSLAGLVVDKSPHSYLAFSGAEAFARQQVSLIPYIASGDPDLSTTAEALKVLDSCGIDIIELGVPYSDPLADGPVIQAAAFLSLARGTNFDAITSLLKKECFLGNHGVPDYATMVERLSNSIGGEVDAGDSELMSPGLLVQRNNLFYGRCYIKGKLCSLVIDSGSSKNIIAESMCKGLNLTFLEHPEPYMLGGICGTGIPISQQAVVPLTVGDYGDTLLLDVVPTPVVDVLLGRPWISDMDVMHYGRANVYDIRKDGRTIRLYPLTPVQIGELLNEIKESRAENRS